MSKVGDPAAEMNLRELVHFAYDRYSVGYPHNADDVLGRLGTLEGSCAQAIPLLCDMFPQYDLEEGPLASVAALEALVEGVEGAGAERFARRLGGLGPMEVHAGLKAPLGVGGVAVAAAIGDEVGPGSGFIFSVSSLGSSATDYEPIGKHIYVHPGRKLAIVTLARPDGTLELKDNDGTCRLELEADEPFDPSQLAEPDRSILGTHGLPGLMYRQVQAAARLVCEAVRVEP